MKAIQANPPTVEAGRFTGFQRIWLQDYESDSGESLYRLPTLAAASISRKEQ